jgi:hypothetical protein
MHSLDTEQGKLMRGTLTPAVQPPPEPGMARGVPQRFFSSDFLDAKSFCP